ncbi:hypothetical protein [Dickeya sp. ws52]|uniref:hypothetical protein n=1 Tax=Dickeya sp. ws52 TaxID=2576377 RepID=UPI00118008A2|nr:hypothetical protein [Dickeya sp. ws52]TYL42738.1 hypothetical protein FDP13_10325 [Dickeya sp. ws52]
MIVTHHIGNAGAQEITVVEPVKPMPFVGMVDGNVGITRLPSDRGTIADIIFVLCRRHQKNCGYHRHFFN